MLSYRHAFHAGNFADVLKHSVLTLVLDYMTQKDKGFSYIDSHAGAGMYQLQQDFAQKTGEYKQGIEKLLNASNIPEPLTRYVDLIKQLNQRASEQFNTTENELNYYPGSPAIAKAILRRQDNSHLFELHPTDFELLTEFCQRWKKSFIKQSDGYKGVLANVPPATRRGVVLIDPPYEIKTDYMIAVQTIIDAYRKFSTGCYILWYPVVQRQHIQLMEQTLKNSQVRNVLQVEWNLTADSTEYGMTGSGLFIVNPPWQLKNQLNSILPFINTIMGSQPSHFKLEQLIAE